MVDATHGGPVRLRVGDGNHVYGAPHGLKPSRNTTSRGINGGGGGGGGHGAEAASAVIATVTVSRKTFVCA